MAKTLRRVAGVTGSHGRQVPSAEREALERQNAAIMAVFERAGFDHIAPDIIQPADIFLERSGEDIRARTFVFTDPVGRGNVPEARPHRAGLPLSPEPCGEPRGRGALLLSAARPSAFPTNC